MNDVLARIGEAHGDNAPDTHLRQEVTTGQTAGPR
jgi:hypothetical protein